jgi:hypothetical protein
VQAKPPKKSAAPVKTNSCSWKHISNTSEKLIKQI